MKSIANAMGYLRTPLDLPIALFVTSGLVGIWASYDPTTSWQKFAMIVAAVAIYYGVVVARAAPQVLSMFVWLFLIGCAALAIYFVTQNDYATGSDKFAPITALGVFLTSIVPQLPFHRFQPNIVAGALEIALPVNIALLASQQHVLSEVEGSKIENRKSAPRFTVYCSLFTFVLITFGLLMTSSRGAWLALGAVGVCALAAAFSRNVLKRYALPLALIVLLGFVIVARRLGETLGPTIESVLGAVPAGGSAISRLELSSQAWRLIQDYYFTGAGLGVFTMVYSTYTLLIDVPFLTHAHNLFLEVWIEQGLLGFVAFAWLIVEFYLWAWRSRTALSWLALGGIAAASVMLLHGFVDVLLYSSRGLPLMFVPMGIAVASSQLTTARGGIIRTAGSANRRSQIVIGAVVVVTLVLIIMLGWTPLAALWYANLGSKAQTRGELAQYEFPTTIVEDIRRTADLSEAESFFQQTLLLDPGNVTANQRLGAIALARGEYDSAHDYLQAAYARDAANAVTWQLLGDAYLAQGRLDDAYALWSRVEDAVSKLDTEAWIRYQRHGDEQRAALTRTLQNRITKERAQ